jgi:hypothetical protein
VRCCCCCCCCLRECSYHGALRLHRSVDAKLQRIEQTLLAKIPAHSRVLPLLDLPEAQWRDYLIHRLGNYVVLRDSYSPHIFAVRGQHPLRHLPWGDQREVANLQVTDEEWRYYDYVLLYQRSRKLDASLASHLTPLGSQDDFHLLASPSAYSDDDSRCSVNDPIARYLA